jgi:hypothetical protein
MADKPKRASEYKSEQVELVRATCLYVATKLGDMMEDLVIVGGLVPSLIVDQTTLPQDVDAHVGTMDLDVGLQLALLDEGRYRKLTERRWLRDGQERRREPDPPAVDDHQLGHRDGRLSHPPVARRRPPG